MPEDEDRETTETRGQAPAERPGARVAGNEVMALNSLRRLTVFNEMYRVLSQRYAASLKDLAAESYIDDVLGSGTKSGYRFIYRAEETRWSVEADPLDPGVTGVRSFFADETGIIRQSESGAATSDSPPVYEERLPSR